MRYLFSTIGSRGDVQPLLAMANELAMRGHCTRFCVPPNFTAWIVAHGHECVSMGPDVELMAAMPLPATPRPRPTQDQLQQLATRAVREQFSVLQTAVEGCDAIIAGMVVQYAAPSIAEVHGLPYRFVAYSPATFPSAAHPPPKMIDQHPFDATEADNLQWQQAERERWQWLFGIAINDERSKLGLAPITDVKDYQFGTRPLLAADPLLAPAPVSPLDIQQHGAWILPDTRPLPDPVEHFLAAGPPPVYIGFGSMRTEAANARLLVAAAHALGKRVLLSSGWSKLAIDAGPTALLLGDVNHSALFPRVAAIVHHGGAGTTTAAAVAGTPQVVIPRNYDQPWWARRVQQLGIGVACSFHDGLTVDALAATLREGLAPEMAARAQALAPQLIRNGVQRAALTLP
jgi:vancomycin aglycone glucosyltransferase